MAQAAITPERLLPCAGSLGLAVLAILGEDASPQRYEWFICEEWCFSSADAVRAVLASADVKELELESEEPEGAAKCATDSADATVAFQMKQHLLTPTVMGSGLSSDRTAATAAHAIVLQLISRSMMPWRGVCVWQSAIVC